MENEAVCIFGPLIGQQDLKQTKLLIIFYSEIVYDDRQNRERGRAED
jgi:hypothetical protein